MGQLANPGSPGKMAVKTECVCIYTLRMMIALYIVIQYTLQVLS